MSTKITSGSAEHVCFHEAGHAIVALDVGASVVEMELYLDPQRNHGRSRMDRTQEQARHIALGGFAAEYLLYKAGHLVKSDGSPLTEKEFIDLAYNNASDDYEKFWMAHKGSADPQKLGMTKVDMDRLFIDYAVGRANRMHFGEVKQLAEALQEAGKLDEQGVRAALGES